MVYQWHREGFDLPSGATLLAKGDVYPNQAFRYGNNAYALQFHTELTLAMMMKWLTKGAHRMGLPGAQCRKQHIEGRLVHDAAVQQWLDDFLDVWIGTADNPAETRTGAA